MGSLRKTPYPGFLVREEKLIAAGGPDNRL